MEDVVSCEQYFHRIMPCMPGDAILQTRVTAKSQYAGISKGPTQSLRTECSFARNIIMLGCVISSGLFGLITWGWCNFETSGSHGNCPPCMICRSSHLEA
ncbi:hypothetical protein BDW62DRAFT_188867 [Aspergillus aurantiobrunneus]